MTLPLSFRPLAALHLPLLHDWLGRPHVTAWWGAAPTLEEVHEEYAPLLAPPELRPLDAPGGTIPYLAWEGGTPVAFAQAYRVMAHQAEGWWPDETDPHALGSDQLIGPPERLGQGLGTRVIRAFAAFLFEDPRVTSLQVDPSPTNARAIAAYRKAGFADVGLVETLDGPAWLMRLRR
jgi:RimJ/RimL family protein N-acetyltransferase